MKTLPDNSVDSIVTDPPYWISFMGKKRDYDVPKQEIREEAKRVLKPWWYLLAFAGTRTQHRMACRIEDAGFEIRDMIAWVYGSGFPKSLNIGKAVDKLQGNNREYSPNPLIKKQTGTTGTVAMNAKGATLTVSKGTSEWEGCGTALKPALEPITVARKQLSEKTVAENVLKWWTGGINIDGSRVEIDKTKEIDNRVWSEYILWEKNWINSNSHFWTSSNENLQLYKENWRFPANFIHDWSDEVTDLFPNTAIWSFPKATWRDYKDNAFFSWIWAIKEKKKKMDNWWNASRYFKTCEHDNEQSIFYCAKANKRERNRGCEELEDNAKVFNGQSSEPLGDMKWVEQKFTTQPAKNNHPTVKPIALMEYLVKLVTPKWWIVLDPFMWSWSTGIACKKNWFDFIGCEMCEEYIEIAKCRINAQD